MSSFNIGHGAADIPREKVQAARADWARWWLALDQTSRDLAAGRHRNIGRTTVRGVFHRAHVPTSPNLRATRLGLVWLVRHNLGTSITIPPGWPAAVAPNARWNHPLDVTECAARTGRSRRSAPPVAPARAEATAGAAVEPALRRTLGLGGQLGTEGMPQLARWLV